MLGAGHFGVSKQISLQMKTELAFRSLSRERCCTKSLMRVDVEVVKKKNIGLEQLSIYLNGVQTLTSLQIIIGKDNSNVKCEREINVVTVSLGRYSLIHDLRITWYH